MSEFLIEARMRLRVKADGLQEAIELVRYMDWPELELPHDVVLETDGIEVLSAHALSQD